MPKGHPSVSKDVKEQILKRIKEEGVPVKQLAEEHGLKPRSIYLSVEARGVSSPPSAMEVDKLRRENQALKELIGQITLDMTMAAKKGR